MHHPPKAGKPAVFPPLPPLLDYSRQTGIYIVSETFFFLKGAEARNASLFSPTTVLDGTYQEDTHLFRDLSVSARFRKRSCSLTGALLRCPAGASGMRSGHAPLKRRCHQDHATHWGGLAGAIDGTLANCSSYVRSSSSAKKICRRIALGCREVVNAPIPELKQLVAEERLTVAIVLFSAQS
jgi:hypothetical protein